MDGVRRNYVSDFLCHDIQLTGLQIEVVLLWWLWELNESILGSSLFQNSNNAKVKKI